MKILSRQDIISAAIDLYGYSEDDFDDMPTAKEIVAYLDMESHDAYPDVFEAGGILAQIREYSA
jgi:hypothetical protein